jgi:hypothetical protein
MISIWFCCFLLSKLQIKHLLLLLITINICIWDGSAQVSKPRWYYFCFVFVIVWVAYKAFVQNVMNITRLLINPDIPEALQLKNGYVFFLLYIYITLEFSDVDVIVYQLLWRVWYISGWALMELRHPRLFPYLLPV